MRARPDFARGVMCGMLVTIAATSLNWLITPAAHPGAGTARNIGVAVQAAVCLLGAWWVGRRPQRPAAPAEVGPAA